MLMCPYPLRVYTMETITSVMAAEELETHDRMAAAGSIGALAAVAIAFAAVTAPVAAAVALVAVAGAVAMKRWGLAKVRSLRETRERSRRQGPRPVAAD